MRRIIHVKAQDVDVRSLFAKPPAKDANLMACLGYLAACEEGVTTTSEMGRAFNVSDFTVLRWLKSLSKLGLVVVSLSVDGQVTVGLRVGTKDNGNGNGSREGNKLGGTEPEGLSKNASGRQPSPPATPSPAKEIKTKHDIVLSITQQHRYDKAMMAYERCSAVRQRGNPLKVSQMLMAVVKNPMFDKLDIEREMFDADAFLVRKNYTDMVKYLMNWFRRSAKSKRTLKNVNEVPSGKYDALARAARR